jgi:general secretion pathway protein C
MSENMESPYRDSSWAADVHEECTCVHACFACRTRVADLAREASGARARRRLGTVALLAMGALAGTFAYECIGLTRAIERLSEATRQSSTVALQRPALPPPAPVPRTMPSPRALQVSFESALRPAIIRESDTTFLIDRRLVDLVLEDQASLVRSARIVPEMVDGRTYPRLFGVRPYTLLGMLGFQNGDRLESINGFDLSTPERALEAYARLRTADFLEARVNRGGKVVKLSYEMW